MIDFKFDWKPEMETHIESIDIQHKQLFKYGREIEQAIKIKCIGVSQKELVDIVCHLREYVSYNTYEEEKIMGEMSYSKMEQHLEIHNKLIRDIMQINVLKLKEEPLKNLIEIHDIIVLYIFSHLLTDDLDIGKAYSVYKSDLENQETKGEKKEKEKEKTFEEKEKQRLFGHRICVLDVSEVYLYKNQTREGEVVVVFKEKVKKLTRLSALERSSFFANLACVTKHLEKEYQPDAVDYLSYEDLEGRLNFHVILKRKEDEDWGKPTILYENIDTLDKKEYKERAEKLKKLFQN